MTTQGSDVQAAQDVPVQTEPADTMIVYGDAAYRDTFDKERRKLYKTHAVPEVAPVQPRKTTRLSR